MPWLYTQMLLVITLSIGCSTQHNDIRIAVMALGPVSDRQIDAVVDGVQKVHHLRATILPGKSMPSSAYVRSRDRYDGNAVLADLSSIQVRDFDKVIGVTNFDIGINRDGERASGIMGIAELDGRAALVSTHRLSFGGVSPSKQMERLSRVAAHECGHTLGLPHCARKGCLMNDARGAIATIDATSGRLCVSCRFYRPFRLKDDALVNP
ncbi:MAG: matrixin family metalloprotease [Verrucomicrobiaceae bacterium]|nr:matrixin family metalloprotease [Verrucomicrobiaceae bacterium]